ncbi:hypothetical protein HY338_03460 [Candidatus Gottesmanbacteria bacterium]|nr:hypothetical protein [Candidatus Gottesmanbacteria bacterium]
MNLFNMVYAVDIGAIWKVNSRFDTLGSFVSFLLPILLLLAGIIFFVLVIAAGFTFLQNAGSEDAHALDKWKQILTYGVIGLIIIFGAYWVLQIINLVTYGSFQSLF